MGMDQVRQGARGYYAIHLELMADIKRFRAVQGHWENIDDATFKKLKDYFGFHAFNFKLHNHAADEHFMPHYVKTVPELKPIIEAFAKERAEISRLIDRLQQIFNEGGRSEVDIEMKKYLEYIESHLDRHMKEVMFVGTEKISKEKQEEIEKAFLKELSKEESQLNLAWVIDGMDDKYQKEFLATIPFPVRVIYRLVLKPAFDRKVRVFQEFFFKTVI